MFELPLTIAEEYWVGYLRADGCIVRKPRGKVLVFAQTNPEPVYAYAKFVGAENAIKFTEKISNFGPNPMHQIASAKGVYALDDLGAKTELHPPLYKSKHFWRGLLDGDGSIGMQKNSNRLYPVICWSGSETDMIQLSIWLSDLMNSPPLKVGKARSIFRVGTNGAKAAWLAKYLYEGEYSALSYKREAAKIAMAWSSTSSRSWKFTPST